MTPSTRRAPSGSRIPAKRIASLAFNLSRAMVLRGEWKKEDRRVRRRAAKLPQEAGLTIANLARWLTFYSLWLACVQVVVEGYDRSHRYPNALLSDEAIDQLLTSSKRSKLRRFRNTILHPELYDHPDTNAVMQEYLAFAKWASDLTDQFERVLKEKL